MALLHCGLSADDAFFDIGEDGGARADAGHSIDPPDAPADATPPPLAGLAAVQVVAGDAHSCAVDANGRVFCWGSNAYGQLGQPLDLAAISVPRQVELPTRVRAVRLAAGSEHTCALTERDNLVCWGRNATGQLARPASSVGLPEAIVLPPALATARFVGVAAGRDHTCAIYVQPQVVTDAGDADAAAADEVLRVACWGSNGSAQLARDDVAFTELPADVRRGAGGTSGPSVVARSLALGDGFSVAGLRVGESYRVQAWGSAQSGAVSTDPDAGPRVPPTNVVRPDGGLVEEPVQLGAGAGHACAAIRVADFEGDASDGLDASDDDAGAAPADGGASAVRIVCWGANESGQLGRDVATERELAEPPANDPVLEGELVLGGRATCLVDRATLRCAGSNEHAQLGIGSADLTPHPVFAPVVGLGAVVGAALGARHACAIVASASGMQQVACWGDNREGQLGDAIALGAGYADASAQDRYRRGRPALVVPPN